MKVTNNNLGRNAMNKTTATVTETAVDAATIAWAEASNVYRAASLAVRNAGWSEDIAFLEDDEAEAADMLTIRLKALRRTELAARDN